MARVKSYARFFCPSLSNFLAKISYHLLTRILLKGVPLEVNISCSNFFFGRVPT